jgi:hypothetical protein
MAEGMRQNHDIRGQFHEICKNFVFATCENSMNFNCAEHGAETVEDSVAVEIFSRSRRLYP